MNFIIYPKIGNRDQDQSYEPFTHMRLYDNHIRLDKDDTLTS